MRILRHVRTSLRNDCPMQDQIQLRSTSRRAPCHAYLANSRDRQRRTSGSFAAGRLRSSAKASSAWKVIDAFWRIALPALLPWSRKTTTGSSRCENLCVKLMRQKTASPSPKIASLNGCNARQEVRTIGEHISIWHA